MRRGGEDREESVGTENGRKEGEAGQ